MTAEFSTAVLSVVHRRSEWVCEICGLNRATEHHHRRPRGSGGTQQTESRAVSNCLHACSECHRIAEKHRNLARVLGWLVSQFDSPSTAPVVYRGRRVLLDDLGNLQEAA